MTQHLSDVASASSDTTSASAASQAGQTEVGSNLNHLNQDISARIYQRFAQGKIITRLGYNSLKSASYEDKDYTYLFRYINEFTLLYKLIGKELEYRAKGEFFYINNFSDSEIDEADEHALKTQAILLILGRYFEMTGRSIHNLAEESLGFNEKDIADISQNDEYKAICKALRFPNWQKAIDYMVARGFVFATSSNHYFLSSAGSAFCDMVVDAHNER
jgi:hypothetical protein